MHVTMYSHNFAVTGYDRYGFEFLKRFGIENLGEVDYRAVKTNRWRRKMNQELLPTIKRVYAARTKNGREFRFHINCLGMFKDAIAKDNLLRDKVTYETVPVYKATKMDIKVLPKYSPFEEQIPLIKYLSSPELYSKVLSLRTGGGKMQHPDEPVLTTKGWIKIGSLKAGDQVYTPSGDIANVTRTFNHSDKKLYDFVLNDNRSTKCGLEHLWGCWIDHAYATRTTEEILDALKKRKLVEIPNIYEYDGYVNDPIPMDSFLFGYLFTNSRMKDGQIVIGIQSTDSFERLTSILKGMGLELKSYKWCRTRFNITPIEGSDKDTYADFCQTLKDVKIWHVDRSSRRMPNCYRNGSSSTRYSLYKGMKAGIYHSNLEESFKFSTTQWNLIKPMVYLARSFGFETKVTTGKGTRPDDITRRVSIDEIIKDRVEVKAVKPIAGTHDAVCIEIDSPERLYITRDFIVTHNTYCSLQAAANVGGRVLITIETKFFKLWEEALLPTINGKPNDKQILDLKTEEVMFIQGGKDLKRLMELAIEEKLGDIKAIVMAARTFTLYLETYERYPNEIYEYYPLTPVDFYHAIDVGTRIKDELHLGLASNFNEELYLHIGNSISLSATLENGTFKDTILGWMFPMNTRAPDSELKKYIDCTALMYNLVKPGDARYTVRGSEDYNHNEYEKWIMKDKKRLATYLNMVSRWCKVRYLSTRESGQNHKGVVFATSIEMATLMQKHLAKTYPELKVSRYAASTGDNYDKAKQADVMVTTIKSFGTGFDWEGLICTLMTTAIDSPDANIQTLGRLRELKKWPHIVPTFDYLVCANLPKHIQYHENKLRIFAERVKSHKTQWMNVLIS